MLSNKKLSRQLAQKMLLIAHLKSNSNNELKYLDETPVNELNNLEDYESYDEIIKTQEIRTNLYTQKDYDSIYLLLVNKSKLISEF